MFAPLHYEPNYAYPLLVWLHGGGDSERQLRRIMPAVSLRNYVAVAPQGTLSVPRKNNPGNGYRWVQTPEHVAQAEQRVLAAIAAAQLRFHIRPDRIFLAGYECGGTMAFRIATEHADRFAGVVSLCGPFPTQGTPLAKLDVVRELPLFVAACREGKSYPTEQVCDNLRLFHSAGMSITLARVSRRRRPDAANASRHRPLDHGTDHAAAGRGRNARCARKRRGLSEIGGQSSAALGHLRRCWAVLGEAASGSISTWIDTAGVI